MMNYFETPTQVIFASPDYSDQWLQGIAYRDEIICACCGGIYEIDEILCTAREDGRSHGIYPYEDWVNFSYEIYGGELPEGLVHDENRNIIEKKEER